MTDISPIGRSQPPVGPSGSRQASSNASTPVNGSGRADTAEFSTAARLAGLAADPPLRTSLIERVRSEIEAGTYETPDKIDQLLDELAIDLA